MIADIPLVPNFPPQETWATTIYWAGIYLLYSCPLAAMLLGATWLGQSVRLFDRAGQFPAKYLAFDQGCAFSNFGIFFPLPHFSFTHV